MIINASIQVIPLSEDKKTAYAFVDEAISLITESGLKYIVGAFETTIEGQYDEVQGLLLKIQDNCYKKKETAFLVYSKLHICGGRDILLEDKKLDR